MFNNYLRIAFRLTIRHTGYSTINIAGLAMGMACCLLITLWVQDELGYDQFHENSSRLFRVISNIDGNWTATSPWAIAPVLKNDFPEVSRATRYSEGEALIKAGELEFYESVALVDPDFFDMFSFPLINGNPETAFAAPNFVIISRRSTARYFGDDDPLGKVLIMDNEQLLTVTGVTENVPGDSHMQFDLLAPVTLLDEERLASWAVETGAYVLLQQNVAVAEFRDKISGTTMKYDRRIENADVINDIQAIAGIHLYALNGLGRIVYVYIFTSIAFFVLIIACINFINLTTAKSSNRSREVGMRKVVGATRKNLIEQFFGESLLLSAIAMLAAMALVYLLLPVFNNLADKQLSIDIVGDSGLIIVLAGITLFTGIVSGSYPALFLSSLQTTKVLKGSSAVGSGNPLFRRILVIFQFTMVIILIISSMMIYRQLTYMENKDLGFDRELVAVLPMNPDLQADYLAFKNELLASAGIENVTSASSIPTAVGNINPVYWEGRGPDQYEIMNFAAVDADYIETFDMEIVAGRGFSEEFGSETENYIVNEEAVRLMGLESPIGKLFSIWTNEGQIVGVVKNFHSQSLHNEIAPLVLTLSTDWSHDYIFAKIRPESPQQTLQYLESTWNTFSPDYPFDYRFVEDVFRQQYSDDRQMGTIPGYFTLLSIFISSLGLLGLTSFLAEQRTKEIGIRKVLGASVPEIVALVSKEFLLLLMVAITIAWPIAYFTLQSMLSTYAYRTDVSLWVFVTGGALACIIALLTVSFQSLKAARANPIVSLKYE